MEIITVKEAAAISKTAGFKVTQKTIDAQIRRNFRHLAVFAGKKLVGLRASGWRNFVNIRRLDGRELFSVSEV